MAARDRSTLPRTKLSRVRLSIRSLHCRVRGLGPRPVRNRRYACHVIGAPVIGPQKDRRGQTGVSVGQVGLGRYIALFGSKRPPTSLARHSPGAWRPSRTVGFHTGSGHDAWTFRKALAHGRDRPVGRLHGAGVRDLVLAIVHRGVRISTRTQLWLALISIAVLVVFFVKVVVRVGGDNGAAAFSPAAAEQGWGGILFAVLYGVLLFVGFETAANLAEETRHPKRDIPRAMLWSVLIASGFYVLGTYAQVAGYGFDMKAMTDAAAAPLIGLGEPYGNVWIRRTLELVVILDMIAVFIGCSVAATRGVYALARDRWLPAPLARISERRGTPVGGTVLIGVVYVLVILTPNLFPGLLGPQGPPPYVAVFAWLSAFGSFSLAVTYLLVSAGAVRGLARHPRPVVVYGCALAGVAVTGAAIFGTLYKVPSPTIYAVYAALAVLVIGIVVAALRRSPAPAPESPASRPAPPAGARGS
ncbi:MAG: amino acid permease [Streptosporangiales bacterium]|nr:amino acid permease [Streptosporangiales bacterium]